jgi:hypothetical protein
MGRVSAFVNNIAAAVVSRRQKMLRVPDARFIVAFDRASEADSVRMGGKCASLARMIAAGVNVPNGFAITTDAYAEHSNPAGCAAGSKP